METSIIVIGLCLTILIVIFFCLILHSRNKEAKAASSGNTEIQSQNDIPNIDIDNEQASQILIKAELLPVDKLPDESRLIEITDSKVLARIDNLIPNLAQTANNVSNTKQAVQLTGKAIYSVKIPAGEQIANSRATEGAFRGFYHGKHGIKGHADLIPEKGYFEKAAAANATSVAMSVASLIVGQYYMTQINKQLNNINAGLSQITDFQNNEFRSKVISLITLVTQTADYLPEILENEELRMTRVYQINGLYENCVQLLTQASITLETCANKKYLDYESYEKELKNVENWCVYQQMLLATLYRITDLLYTLQLGEVSRAQYNSLLQTHTECVKNSRKSIANWHKDTCDRLGIDIEKSKRKRLGFDKALFFIPGLFNEEFNFREINETTSKMIENQSSCYVSQSIDSSDLFTKDVQLIAKDGKIYYLPDGLD